MAVVSRDIAGAAIDAKVSAIAATVSAAPANTVQSAALSAAQLQAQSESVFQKLATGRLAASTVLAASVFGPAGTAALTIPASDIATTALQSQITALGTPAAGFQQSSENQLLDNLQRQLLSVALAKGYTTPAAILAASL
jgi:hypothetical protein